MIRRGKDDFIRIRMSELLELLVPVPLTEQERKAIESRRSRVKHVREQRLRSFLKRLTRQTG
jgi:hypothetical protein